ncbi:MAG: hypothetical protein GY702_20400 [Desulfobulbaceae bacterium]|nr:hypothetical protein [Desulfobulbaceae bacterium]
MISVISLENIDRQLLQYAIFYCSHAGGNNIQKRSIVFGDNLAGHLFFCRSMDTINCEGGFIDISTYKPKRIQQLM